MPKAVVPAYLEHFRCDGPRCPDNCCYGSWKIHVDEKHYKRMKKLTDPELKPLVDRYVKRNRKQPSTSATFGKLVQDYDKGHCAFLADDRRCNLQLKAGADHLCDVCMLYPRLDNTIIGRPMERSLSLSCPLAAELALLDPDSLTFHEVDLNLYGREMTYSFLNPYDNLDKRPEKRYFQNLREFTIQVLR